MTPEQKGAGRIADRALRGYQRDMDLINGFAESIRKPSHKPVEMPHLWEPQLAHEHPEHSISLTHTYYHPVVGSLCVPQEQ